MPVHDDAALMRRAIAAAHVGLAHGAGPFGAILVDEHEVVRAVGVNQVVVRSDPTAHAEVTVIRRVTSERATYALGGTTLVTTCAPCLMCAGAIHWAGIARVVMGARKSDAEAIGFVEGPAGFDAAAFLAARGIAVVQDVEREAAVALLRAYRGPTY